YVLLRRPPPAPTSLSPYTPLFRSDEAPIIRLINALLSEAVKENAPDIHIEPFENRLSIRLRVYGVLREVLEPPRALAPVIVPRSKAMAKLDIAQKRLPLGGRTSLRMVGCAVGLRGSTLRSRHAHRAAPPLTTQPA